MPQARRINKYEILEELGHGGFATVHEARDSDWSLAEAPPPRPDYQLPPTDH